MIDSNKRAELEKELQAIREEKRRLLLEKELQEVRQEKKKLLSQAQKEEPEFSDKELEKIASGELSPETIMSIRQGKRSMARFGRNVATGIASRADLPNLAAMGAHAAGWKKTPTFYEPIAQRVENAIDEYTGGKYKPQTKGEEWEDALVQGVSSLGGSAPKLAAKGLMKVGASGKVGKAAEKISQVGSNKLTGANITGALGSTAGSKYYAENTEDPSILGSLLAGAIGGTGARTALNAKNIAAGTAGISTGFRPPEYKKLTDLGMPVSLANTAREGAVIPSKFEYYSSKTPGLEKHFRKFYNKQDEAIARNLGMVDVEDLAKAVEAPAKNLAVKGAEGYNRRISAAYGKRKEKFAPREMEAITNKELVDISHLIKDLEYERSLSVNPKLHFDNTKNGKLLETLKKSIPNRNQSNIRKQLENQGYPQNLIDQMISEDNTPQAMGFKDLNKIRKDALDESKTLKTNIGEVTDASIEAYDRYKKLSKARNSFIESVGTPNQVHNSKVSRKMWAVYKNQGKGKKRGLSNFVGDITGANNDHEAFLKVTKDPRYFNVVMQGLSRSERPELAQAIAAEAGKQQGKFSNNKFYTVASKWDPEVRAKYKKALGSKEAEQGFEHTMEFVRNNKKMLENIANASGTSHSLRDVEQATKAAKLIGLGIKGAVVGGTAAAAFTTKAVPFALGVALHQGGARLWTNQKFLSRVNKVMTTTKPEVAYKSLEAALKTANQLGRQTKEHVKTKEKDSKA